MKYKLTIQEKLKDLRIEYGLKLKQLADTTGISKFDLSAYIDILPFLSGFLSLHSPP